MSHLKTSEEALMELASRAADRSRDGLRRIIASARRHLDMDIAVVAQFSGEREVVRAVEGKEAPPGLEPGAVWPAGGSLGKRLLDGRIGTLVP